MTMHPMPLHNIQQHTAGELSILSEQWRTYNTVAALAGISFNRQQATVPSHLVQRRTGVCTQSSRFRAGLLGGGGRIFCVYIYRTNVYSVCAHLPRGVWEHAHRFSGNSEIGSGRVWHLSCVIQLFR